MRPVLLTDADSHGVSPKARLAAALTSSAGTIAAVLIAWLVAGVELDRAAIAGALTGGTLAAIAYAGAWLGSTGTVRVSARAVEASDQLAARQLRAAAPRADRWPSGAAGELLDRIEQSPEAGR